MLKANGDTVRSMDEGIRVAEDTVIPLEEIQFRASRSSGPGGQHANVTASRIEAVFDVDASGALSDDQRDLLRRRSASASPRSPRMPAARPATGSSPSSACAEARGGPPSPEAAPPDEAVARRP